MSKSVDDFVEIPFGAKLKIGETFFARHPITLSIATSKEKNDERIEVLTEIISNYFTTITYEGCSSNILKLKYQQTSHGLRELKKESIPFEEVPSKEYTKYRKVLKKAGLAP